MIAAVMLVFAALFLGFLALFLAVNNARQSPAAKLKSRLRRMAGSDAMRPSETLTEELFREVTPAERLFYRLPMTGNLKELIERSGVRVTPMAFVLWTGAASAICFVALFALRGNALIALLAALAIAFGAFIFLGYRKKQRAARFTEQLPDALTMISRSLRAGHSLSGAVELVSEELPEPAGLLFKIAYEQQRLGMRMADSLGTLPEKIESIDLRFFVAIIRINSETGGNLAEVMDKLAETIRSRLQIRRQVQTYTAEGRLSGYVLVILPMAVFGLFYLLQPSYMDVFFKERSCQLILAAAGLGQFIGFLFIKKIVNIRI